MTSFGVLKQRKKCMSRLLCIVGELARGGSMIVAVSVGDRLNVTDDT